MTVLEVALDEREVKAMQRQALALSRRVSTRKGSNATVEVDAETLRRVLRFVTSALLSSTVEGGTRRSRGMASGRSHGTTVAPAPDDEITPQQAATILGMSRPSVMRLIQQGTLHPRKVMSRNKLSRAEVMAFQEANTREQRRALENLSALSEEFDF